MAKKDLSTVAGFQDVLKNYEKSIAQLLKDKYGISAEEFFVTCINAVKKNPKLLHCTPHSLFGAILLSAEVGLRPNTPDQHAFLIPYKGEVKFQIGYKGLIEIMYRNKRVKSVNAIAVYENDEFDYGFGLEPFLIHKPFRGKDRGRLVATYAVVKLADADPIFSVVEDYELQELQEFSASKDSDFSPYNSGADVHNFMQIKASVKKISKLIPKQNVNEISRAVEVDSKIEGGASLNAPVLDNPNDEVMANLVENSNSKALESAFDNSEDTLKEVSKSVNSVEKQKVKTPQQSNSDSVEKEGQQKQSLESAFDDDADDVDFSDLGNVKPEPKEEKKPEPKEEEKPEPKEEKKPEPKEEKKPEPKEEEKPEPKEEKKPEPKEEKKPEPRGGGET